MNNLKTKLAEDLRKWVKEKWVDIGAPKKGGGYKPCGRSEGEKRKGYPKCVPAAKASRMSKKQKKSAVRRKRAAGNPGGKPTMVSTFKSKKESVELFGQIILEKLCAKGKAAAKRKYDVYPSAYANMYASAVCSGKVKSGGKKKKKKQNSSTQIYGNVILEAYRKFMGEALDPEVAERLRKFHAGSAEAVDAQKRKHGVGTYRGSGARTPRTLAQSARERPTGTESENAENAQKTIGKARPSGSVPGSRR